MASGGRTSTCSCYRLQASTLGWHVGIGPIDERVLSQWGFADQDDTALWLVKEIDYTIIQARGISYFRYVMHYVNSHVKVLLIRLLKVWISAKSTNSTIILSTCIRSHLRISGTDTCSLWNYEPSEGHIQSNRGRHWQAFMASILPKRRQIVLPTEPSAENRILFLILQGLIG
jgi:hypothetical protein